MVAAGKRVPAFRQLYRTALYARRGVRYRRLTSRIKLDSRLVVFECYAGRAYACSPRAIYQEMLADERFSDFRFVWVFRKGVVRALAARGYSCLRQGETPAPGSVRDKLDHLLGQTALCELERATIVTYGSPYYYALHAEAGTWISNYIVPTHMHVRDGQTYLQTWHGTPLKRLGCDIPRDKRSAMYTVDDIHGRYEREGQRFTRLLSPSNFASEKLASAFALDSVHTDQAIIEEGYPRNDFLHTYTAKDVAEVKERLGIPLDKRVLLYAPTFRDDQHEAAKGYTLNTSSVDFDRLYEALSDEYVVLFRPHYLVANKFNFSKYDGFVINVSKVMDVNDLYIAADVLVTDYSSVFFDYANLKRPIIFYMYDLEHYTEDLRGFYIELDELPGPVVRTVDEFVDAVRAFRGAETIDDSSYTAFNERFTYLDDGLAARRVLSRIFPE
jgi:CDP-glycerol glycerophosphotransferase